MADPHIARKMLEGREHEIRPCVGMGYCIDSHLWRRGAVHPQPGDRARGDDAACRSPAPRPAPHVVVVGAGPGRAGGGAGRRRRAAIAVTLFEAAERGRRADAPHGRAEAPARDHRHRRLARRRMRAARRRRCASTPMPRPTTCRPRARTSSSSRPGGLPNTSLPRRGRGSRHDQLGHPLRRREARPRRCSSTTTTAPIPA